MWEKNKTSTTVITSSEKRMSKTAMVGSVCWGSRNGMGEMVEQWTDWHGRDRWDDRMTVDPEV
jgi:hypothetical protein